MRRFLAGVASVTLVASMAAPAATLAADPIVTGRLLVPGAPLAGGSWGLAFDAEDNLWVGHIGARNITKLDANSGKVLATFGPEAGFEGSDDLAVAPDGSVYYTAILTGEVGRINLDGSHSTVAELGMGVNPVTISDDGRIFVGKAFMGDGLWEVYPDGTTPRLINATSGVNGFDWWDGFLFAPRTATGDVVRIDPDAAGGDITAVVSGLTAPKAVDIAPDGRMFVLDDDPCRVYEFDPHTGAKTLVATLGNVDNMAIDSNGRIYLSGGNDGAIYRLLPNGKTVTISESGVASSSGIAVVAGSDGRGIVYSPEKFLMHAFDGLTGKQLLETGAVPLPDTAAPDGDRLILSGLFTNAVAVWNPATQGIEAYYDTFAAPANAIRFDGDLIIAELGAGRVTRFDQATETSHSWDGFIVPTGLAATADDLYAADWATGILYRLVQDGTSLDTSQVVVTGLMGPEGLAATADGDLVVVETWTRQLSLIDLAASPATVTPLVTGLDVGQLAPAGMAPFWAFDGVAVGPSGEIYVSANGIYRYELR